MMRPPTRSTRTEHTLSLHDALPIFEAEEPDYAEPEAEIDAEPIEADEAAEEAQPEPVEMPASWSKDDAELWESLPPDTQAKMAERIGQQEVGDRKSTRLNSSNYCESRMQSPA